MRRLLAAAWLLALAGCAQAPGASEPSLDWRTSVRGADLVVQLVDRRGHYRVEQVSLVAPSGRRYPAFELTREVRRDDYGYGRPGVGAGGAFGSGGWSSAGVGVTIPLGGAPGEVRGVWTEARIPLPQPAVGPEWKIVVEMTDRSGAQRIAEWPAPAMTE